MSDTRTYLQLPPFEELVALAEENPEAFSLLKQELCEEAILSSPSAIQDRLWALQSHIDRIVGSCKNPNHVNARLIQELNKHFVRFQATLNGHYQPESSASATIIPFPRH